MLRHIVFCLLVPAVTGCSLLQEHGGNVAGAVGVVRTASNLELLEPQYLAGSLIAYAIYDQLAPTWRIEVTRLDEQRVRLDLRMKSFITGGDGEARQVFMRNARQLAESEGLAGFEVARYEEGVESTRPFAQRVAGGEIRLLRSQIWPAL
jgi:hypothetical protein